MSGTVASRRQQLDYNRKLLALILDVDADGFDTPAWSGLKRIETLSPITWESQGSIAKPSGDMTRHLASGLWEQRFKFGHPR